MDFLRVTVDDVQLLERLRNPEKRIAFAVINALNDAAKIAQRAEQLHVQDTLTIRQPAFFFGTPGRPGGVAAKIDFASVAKAKPYVEVYVGQKGRLLLPEFEAGGERRPFVGKTIAVPITGGARPSKGEPVPAELYVKNLKLKPVGGRGGSRRIFVGQQGTYEIPAVGIFQRRPGEQKGQLLYAFKAHEAPIPATLNFHQVVGSALLRNFPAALSRRVDQTLAFHGLSR